MWTKIVSCVIIVTILLYNRRVCGNVESRSVHRVQPEGDLEISKNITIHRNGYGRLLRLLALLKGFHHRNHLVYSPYVISRLWRASFEFELKPHPMYMKEVPSTIYFPTQTNFGVPPHGGSSNSGIGSNTIDSIFHFGNNEQQSSVTIGGSNQIVKGPDERDEIPAVGANHNHVINKDAIDPVVSAPTTEVEEKSERVLRHAIRPRTDEDEDENIASDDEPSEVEDATANTESLTTTQGETETESQTEAVTVVQSEAMTTTTQTETVETPQSETVLTEASSEATTTEKSEQSSTVASTTSTPFPSEWMGYYGYGIHKPEFIESIAFTTNDPPPQIVGEDIHYVTYGSPPFKPSLPDYTNSYSSKFFVPQRYFKR